MTPDKDLDKAREVVGNFHGNFDLPIKLQEGLEDAILQSLADARREGYLEAIEKSKGLVDALGRMNCPWDWEIAKKALSEWDKEK